MGRKKRPFYRLVAIDSKKRRDGLEIERLGWYNPLENNQKRIRIPLEPPRDPVRNTLETHYKLLRNTLETFEKAFTNL